MQLLLNPAGVHQILFKCQKITWHCKAPWRFLIINFEPSYLLDMHVSNYPLGLPKTPSALAARTLPGLCYVSLAAYWYESFSQDCCSKRPCFDYRTFYCEKSVKAAAAVAFSSMHKFIPSLSLCPKLGSCLLSVTQALTLGISRSSAHNATSVTPVVQSQVWSYYNTLCKQISFYFPSLPSFLGNIYFNSIGIKCINDVAKRLELPIFYWHFCLLVCLLSAAISFLFVSFSTYLQHGEEWRVWLISQVIVLKQEPVATVNAVI